MKLSDYLPSYHPFEFQLTVMESRWSFAHSIEPQKWWEEINLLRTALRVGLRQAVCVRGGGACENKKCQEPHRCPAVLLHSPYSAIQREFLPPAVKFWGEHRDGMVVLWTVLWGVRASECFEAILPEVASNIKRAGFIPDTRPTTKVYSGTLGGYINALGVVLDVSTNALIVEIATPLNAGDRLKSVSGYDLIRVAGNAANRLVRWDLEERGLALTKSDPEWWDAPSEARWDVVEDMKCVDFDLIDGAKEIRIKAEHADRNNSPRHKGWVGRFRVSGGLSTAFRWFALLSLWGAGEGTRDGYGYIKLSKA